MRYLLAMLLAAPLACGAQIYRCKDQAGKTIMQQTPCDGGMMVSPPSQRQGNQQPAQNPEARQLTALVAEALSRRDYPRAESLAVTAEHWDMIANSRAREGTFNPATCKFQYHAVGDALGKNLAQAAKEECLSTRG